MDTAIKSCTCKHAFQDKKYGDKKRVYNTCTGKSKFRCTVCSKEIS